MQKKITLNYLLSFNSQNFFSTKEWFHLNHIAIDRRWFPLCLIKNINHLKNFLVKFELEVFMIMNNILISSD